MLLFLSTEDRKLLSGPCSPPLGRGVSAGGGCFEGIFGLFFWFGAVFERFSDGAVLCGADGVSSGGFKVAWLGLSRGYPAESSDPSMGEFDSGEMIEVLHNSGQHVGFQTFGACYPFG